MLLEVKYSLSGKKWEKVKMGEGNEEPLGVGLSLKVPVQHQNFYYIYIDSHCVCEHLYMYFPTYFL